MVFNLRSILSLATVALGVLLTPAPLQAQEGPVNTFKSLVASQKYEDANFYLANGYIAAADIDGSAIFYEVLRARYLGSLRNSMRDIDRLYTYLSGLGPIDLNRTFTCENDSACLLVNDLLYGARIGEIGWFVARGLNLNNRVPEVVPATVPLMLRYGSIYTLADINWLAANGMVLGDESYSLDELVNYRDSYSRLQNLPYNHLNLPANFLNLGDQNFLDLQVIALTTPVAEDATRQSRRRSALCSFITHAASAYMPSFDYLEHVLAEIPEFRGMHINRQQRGNAGIYQLFPTECVLLVQSMANSHARLNEIVDRFAFDGDVETAEWLLKLMQNRRQ